MGWLIIALLLVAAVLLWRASRSALAILAVIAAVLILLHIPLEPILWLLGAVFVVVALAYPLAALMGARMLAGLMALLIAVGLISDSSHTLDELDELHTARSPIVIEDGVGLRSIYDEDNHRQNPITGVDLREPWGGDSDLTQLAAPLPVGNGDEDDPEAVEEEEDTLVVVTDEGVETVLEEDEDGNHVLRVIEDEEDTKLLIETEDGVETVLEEDEDGNHVLRVVVPTSVPPTPQPTQGPDVVVEALPDTGGGTPPPTEHPGSG